MNDIQTPVFLLAKRRRRILVLEDEPLIAIMVAQVLEDFDHECLGPFQTVISGIECARKAEVDAAILNLVIGGEKSYLIAEELARRGIPFGFVSGMARTGFDGPWAARPYLEKPFSTDDLQRLLLELCAPPPETVQPQWS